MIPIRSLSALPPVCLSGDLFIYAPNRVAFESLVPSTVPPTLKCILLGGLSDGLFPVPYTTALASMCFEWNEEKGGTPFTASLVQPILSSSYTGFGHGDLDRDVEELDELMDCLIEHRQAESILLLGHSTGCQQIVHFLKQARHRTRIAAAVLQAPVSDREAATIDPSVSGSSRAVSTVEHHAASPHLNQLHQFIETATQMKAQGRGSEMMARAAFWAPISANRYYDLMATNGKDDYFSSDFSDEELQDRLSHIARLGSTLQRVLVAYSGADEYVPRHIDTPALTQRLCDAMNFLRSEGRSVDIAQPCHIPNGNHNLSSNDGADADIFVAHVKQLLRDLTAAPPQCSS
jgi:pimeloyl-ACP methyl ester carboxylesterase